MVPSVRNHAGVSSDQTPASSCQGSINVRRKTGQFSVSSPSQVATSTSRLCSAATRVWFTMESATTNASKSHGQGVQ